MRQYTIHSSILLEVQIRSSGYRIWKRELESLAGEAAQSLQRLVMVKEARGRDAAGRSTSCSP